MKHRTHRFLIRFLAAYKGNHTYLIVPYSKGAYQCLTIFRKLGIIENFGKIKIPLEHSLASGVLPSQKHNYMVIWFQRTSLDFIKSNRNFGVIQGNEHSPNGKGTHKLKIIRQPSWRHFKFITRKKLIKKKPNKNVIYIIETPKGIVTSEEAIRFNLGGWLLAEIYI